MAVADCSDILKIGIEWQRQQNDVHHKRSCLERRVGRNNWTNGEKETGRQKRLPTLL